MLKCMCVGLSQMCWMQMWVIVDVDVWRDDSLSLLGSLLLHAIMLTQMLMCDRICLKLLLVLQFSIRFARVPICSLYVCAIAAWVVEAMCCQTNFFGSWREDWDGNGNAMIIMGRDTCGDVLWMPLFAVRMESLQT